MRRLRAALLLIASLAGPALAGEFRISPPIDCALGAGERCYILMHFDHDTGPGARDHRCGSLSYDTHGGTDFALRSHAEIAAGISVIAAAPGTVRAVRDGMIDKLYSEAETTRIDGRDCGNGVVISHGGGWETQYCHMRQGSVSVRKGDRVAMGAPLGLVGLSGRTNFPHLHLTVRKDGAKIDPFAPKGPETCNTGPGNAAKKTLWLNPPAYQPTGVISAGFSGAVPSYDAIKQGHAGTDTLTSSAPALVLWGFAYGSQAGDAMRLTITGPDGRAVYTQTMPITRVMAQYFRAGGRKTQGADWWQPGTYTGTIEVLRDDETVGQDSVTVTVSR